MQLKPLALALVIAALLTAPLAAAANRSPATAGPPKQELRALRLRDQALNKIYHLGQYARPSKQELRALRLRGEAINKIYHLGQ